MNFFLVSGDICRLLITFANSMDPNQARQNGGHDLGAMLIDTQNVFLRDSFENVCLLKSAEDKENAQHAKSLTKIII